MEKVWAVVEKVESVDGRSPKSTRIKKIFDDEYDARGAVFSPYEVQEVEVDTAQELKELGAKLTPKQRYAFESYNDLGIEKHLLGKYEDSI